MKKYFIQGTLALAMITSLVACSNDDALSSKSVLPTADEIIVDNSEQGVYLEETFRKPFNIRVQYRWDRNQFGVGRDALRNLYPPARENVIPAMEMVDHVWIQSYIQAAGRQFIDSIRPGEFLLAGGPALNDDGTRTLGLATAGARITLYELDDVVKNVDAAKEYIHTIQHEYIHIINMKAEFDELDFGAETVASYTPNWYEHSNEASQALGFVTNYARSNIFEDFAETASYLLTHTDTEYKALLASLRANGNTLGAVRIENKVAKVISYFNEEFALDFLNLARIANENAANSPLLNGGATNPGSIAPFGIKSTTSGKKYTRYCQSHHDTNNKMSGLHLTKQ